MINGTRRLAVAGLLGLAMGVIVDANVRVSSDGPFYARVERGPDGDPLVHNDGEWAVIPFYRATACVPIGFNLLDFFDVPGAFACEARVVGFDIWQQFPPPPGAVPVQAHVFGLDGMEVWFARWSELSAAMADDDLTLGELETLPSLVKGTAMLFKETLHPTGGARPGLLQMVGFGELEDGRSFSFSSVAPHSRLVHTQVQFR